ARVGEIISRSICTAMRTMAYDYSTDRHWRRHDRFRRVFTSPCSRWLLGRLRGPPSPKHFVQLNDGLQLGSVRLRQMEFRLKHSPVSGQLIAVTRPSSLIANTGEVIGRFEGGHLPL